MCAKPGQFIEAKAASSHDELHALGFVPGLDSPHILAWVDPIEDADHRNENESAKGLPVRRHPHATLRDDPELWSIVDRFRCGVNKDLTHAEFDELSNWQLEAWLIMRAASNREESREMKRAHRGQDGDQ